MKRLLLIACLSVGGLALAYPPVIANPAGIPGPAGGAGAAGATGPAGPSTVPFVDAGAVMAPDFLYGPANPGISIRDVASYDSLIPSRINSQWWRTLCTVPPALPAAGLSVDGYFDVFDLNALNTTSAFQMQTPVQVPSGITSINLTAEMMAGPNNTGTTSIGFAAYGCGSDVGHTSATLTGSLAPYTYTPTGLSANTYYWVTISGNDTTLGSSTTSDPILDTITATPIGGTGFWAKHFWRVESSPQTLWYNTRNTYSGQWASPMSEMVFDTDATAIEVEVYNDYVATGTQLSVAVYVDGRLWTTVQPTQAGAPEFLAVGNLPSGMKRVEVEGGAYIASAGSGPDTPTGTILQAVYVPVLATTYVIQQPKVSRTLTVYGDSISEGYYANVPLAGGWLQLLRRRFPGLVYGEAWSGRSLMHDIGGTGLTYLDQLVDIIQRSHPSDIWIMMGINDWINVTSTLAQFGTAYGALLDGLHAEIPDASIFAGLLGTNEEATTNTNGNTPAQYRGAISTACAARAWCRYYDGTTFVASNQFYLDNLHPAPAAELSLADHILNALMTTTPTSAPSFNWGTFGPTGPPGPTGAVPCSIGADGISLICPGLIQDNAGTSTSTNLIAYGQLFSNAYWGSYLTTVTPGVVGPAGVADGFTIADTGAGGSIYVSAGGSYIALGSSGSYVFSVWLAVASGTQAATINVYDATSLVYLVQQSVNVTTTWTRFSAVFSGTSGHTVAPNIEPGGPSTTATVEAAYAQLESGTTTSPYCNTAGTSASCTVPAIWALTGGFSNLSVSGLSTLTGGVKTATLIVGSGTSVTGLGVQKCFIANAGTSCTVAVSGCTSASLCHAFDIGVGPALGASLNPEIKATCAAGTATVGWSCSLSNSCDAGVVCYN